ncbi:MAG: hypothetical protein FWE05_08185 [Defluviitaleaceae bacterium]|nr:hypothetical protein [Defluviitaleaceae bacterium]
MTQFKLLCKFSTILVLALGLMLVLPAVTVYAEDNAFSIEITEETTFSFTPDVTGYWTFVTSDNHDSDPRLWIHNRHGVQIATDDDTAGNLNAIITVHLVEGVEYFVRAGFWSAATTGTYTLTVSMSDTFVRPVRPWIPPVVIEIPSEGGTVGGHVDDGSFGSFTFMPATSGLWTLEYEGLWMLDVLDNRGNVIAIDELSLPGMNTMTVRLVADVEYTIHGSLDWSTFEYILTVTPAEVFTPWFDWDELASWGIAVDFDAERIPLIIDDEPILVEETTHFSFIPDTTGSWTFNFPIVDFGDAEPAILVTDNYGSVIMIDENMLSPNLNTFYLEEGIEYIVWASFFSWWGFDFDDFGSYNLSVERYVPSPMVNVSVETSPIEIPPVITHTAFPSDGGVVSLDVNAFESFSFTPDTSMSWTIEVIATSSSFSELVVSDISDSFRIFDWSSNITLDLAAGHTYIIEVWGDNDSMLSITPTYQIHPTTGMVTMVRQVTRPTDFSFIPNRTGYWVIQTTNNTGDPLLQLLDNAGEILFEDDDSGGNLNAQLKVYLTEGVEYTIRATFFAGGGRYQLEIINLMGLETQGEFPILAPAI